MKKTNPKKVPRTQADVDRAFDEGLGKGAEIMLYIMTFILVNDWNASDEHLDSIAKRTSQYFREIQSGELKFKDIVTTMKEEYNLEVKI